MLWILCTIMLTLANQASSQILLAQSWTATVCLYVLRDGYPCTSRDYWTMHGIWLNGQVEGVTVNCNHTWPLDEEEIRPIEPELEKYWRNMNASASGRYGLWSHEWTKHGTCVATANISKPLNTQIKYFTQGLDWIKQYAVTSTLKEAGIIPSNEAEYAVTDFFKAIMSQFKIEPTIRCAHFEGRQFISDVIFCFNSTLQMIDCHIDDRFRDQYNETFIDGAKVTAACDFGKGVLYPRSDVDLGFFVNPHEQINSTTSKP